MGFLVMQEWCLNTKLPSVSYIAYLVRGIIATVVIVTVLVVVLGIVSCTAPPPASTLPSGAISWTEAQYHIGDVTTVCGPVVDAQWAIDSPDQLTILNIGREYPDPDRLNVIISINNRGNFPHAPEEYYLGKTICVSGLIYPYKGIPQMSVKDPSQIEEQ